MTAVKSTDRRVARRSEGRSQNNVWQDVHAYFRELFTIHKAVDTINLTTEQLVSDMEARFKGRYNTEMIAKLLKNGFEVKPGHYVFKRDDFFPLAVKEVAP